MAQPPVQLVVGDADEAFREAAAKLAPLANVTVVVAPPNAGDSAFVHSALCYARALELCSQHARCVWASSKTLSSQCSAWWYGRFVVEMHTLEEICRQPTTHERTDPAGKKHLFHVSCCATHSCKGRLLQ